MAKVTEVNVSASRGFNHPYEDYSNLKPFISLRIELEESEDVDKVVKEYQAKAESLVEDHKQHMLDSLTKLHEMAQYQQRVASLEDKIKESQKELDNLRKQQNFLLPES